MAERADDTLADGEEGHEQETVAKFASAVPMGRVGSPEEMGRVALFIATDASSFVNGAELVADGGKAQV